ncbi:MAG: peptidylprolyl isomerase [Bacteroidales bacterium]
MHSTYRIFIGLVLLHIAWLTPVFAGDPVLLRIGDESITLSEFKEVYYRNNDTTQADHAQVEEYLELYIDYRLKVKEAKSQGLDTLPGFRKELNGYRDQLVREFMATHEVTDQLVMEAWERSLYDIRASHILLRLPTDASPEDTLEVYTRIMDVYRKISEGADFSEVAGEVSEDPSARNTEATANQPARRGNGGDLGYFTVFDMLYPFESAAYNTPLGDVSKPVRTDLGYHLIKVTDKLPAMGEARVAHIMLMTPVDMKEEEIAEKEQQIFDIYRQLQEGADFDRLAGDYSEDRQTAGNGGEMAPFTSSRMVPGFIEAIHQLDESGDISSPVRTDFGWHIIKLIDRSPPPPFEEAEEEIRTRLARNDRSHILQNKEPEDMDEDFPEFTRIMQEYHDGILLFEITEKEVWDEAVTDTLGLEAFFGKNRSDYQEGELDSIRGMVVADYQQHLERNWIKKLRKKYDVWVNRELLKTTNFE